MKRILLVVATESEADAFRKIPGIKLSRDGYILGNNEISLLITGVGSVATSWSLMKWLSANPWPDLAMNIGIAGSYKEDIVIGDVVVPVSDCFADSGVEKGNSFLTLSEAGIQDPNQFPFKDGKILADTTFNTQIISKLKQVNAVTVNTSSGSASTIERLRSKYNPDIETMEGATFFYICSGEKIPFLAIRSISNRVEPRDKNKWNIQVALNNLSEKLIEFFLTLD
ncbi:MAG: futalosine hydrolase [Bacteroidia bacterium]|nr:futalosine hydrolase [Bacteroidia bacterium]